MKVQLQKDVLLVTPEIFEDSGALFESFNENEFSSIISVRIISHTLFIFLSQAKIVRVLDGEIFDVAVDLRKDSSTYCKWIGETLSSENNQQLYIPEGFGHAFVLPVIGLIQSQ